MKPVLWRIDLREGIDTETVYALVPPSVEADALLAWAEHKYGTALKPRVRPGANPDKLRIVERGLKPIRPYLGRRPDNYREAMAVAAFQNEVLATYGAGVEGLPAIETIEAWVAVAYGFMLAAHIPPAAAFDMAKYAVLKAKEG